MKLYFFFFLLFCAEVVNGQYHHINDVHYNVNDGLPNNEINDIVKDNLGVVWVATENGLSRYDGYNFVNFNSNTHPTIFKDNKINSIQRNGDFLYLLTQGDGLIKLDPKKLSFQKIYSSKPLSISFSGDTTAFLFESGNLVVNVKNKKLFTLHFKVKPKDNLLIYKGNIYLSLADQGILKVPIKNTKTRYYIPTQELVSLGTLSLSKKYGVIHCDGNNIRIIKNDVLVMHPEMIGKIQINFFREDELGNYMFIERKRIINVKFNKEYKSLVYGIRQNLEYRIICRITENCLLIGTNQGITKITNNPKLSESLNDFSLLKDDNVIVRRSIIENKDKCYFLSFPYIFERGSKIKNLTTRILPVADGEIVNNKLYCTTDGDGLISVNLITKKLTFHSCDVLKPRESLEDISIFSDSLFLITGGNKLVVYNPKINKGKAFYLKSGISIHKAVQKPFSNIIYLGTSMGLFRIRYSENSQFQLVDKIIDKGIDVRDILLRNGKDEIWLATNTGIIVMNLKNSKKLKSFTNQSQVSNPKVVKLLESNNCIWAATYSGFTVINTINNKIRFVNKKHGIFNHEFNYRSGCKLKNGKLIFGGLNTYETINPNSLNQFKYSTNFFISSIESINNNNQKINSSYSQGSNIIFKTGEESIKIYLMNLDFQYGSGYTFEYSLNSKNWFRTDQKNGILISNIINGEYILKIRMYNPFGQLVKGKSFNLIATVPFYKNSVFIISIVTLVLVFCILFMLYFRRSINIKSETKAKIAMDLHDESGTILTRLLLLSKKEKMEALDKDHLQTGLKEVSYNFRTYVDSISRKKHTFQELTDDIEEFINYTCSYSGITPNFNINFDKNILLKSDLFRDIKLTIYEIVNNTIKHSNAEKISLIMLLKNRKINIIISDNGECNISDLDAFKGNGIRNIKKRITRNNGKISYFIPNGESGLTIEINLTI
jgi:hypothetical protein